MALDALSVIWPALTVISIPFSLLGSFFKSKQEKVNNAKALTSENFNMLSDYSRDQVIKKSKEALEQLFKADENEITSFFDILEEQLDEVMLFVTNCSNEFKNGIEKIDLSLAERILQYITNNHNSYAVVKTERDFDKNSFTIYVRCKGIRNKFDILRYQNISTEKIKIKYMD